MNKSIITLALVATTVFPVNAQAFDIGGLVRSAVQDAVTEVVEDTVKSTAKDATKTAVKTAADAAGVKGADKYIDVAVDNADGVQNSAAGLKATSGMIGSGGIGAVSGALSTAAIVADKAKTGGATPRDKFHQEYTSISTKMSNCGSDSKCIIKYQKELADLQKRGDAYTASTGDTNFNGKTDDYEMNAGSVLDNVRSRIINSHQ